MSNGDLASRVLQWFDRWGQPQRPPSPRGIGAAKAVRFGRAGRSDPPKRGRRRR